MSALLDDVLTLIKHSERVTQVESVPLDVRQIVTEVCREMAILVGRKGVDLLCAVDENVPYDLLGDPLRLRQCLTNLCGNAAKFTSHGHISITVTCAHSNEAGSVRLTFRVRDTGCGYMSLRRSHVTST